MQIQACPSQLICGSVITGPRVDFSPAGGHLVLLVFWQRNSMAISGYIFGRKTQDCGFDSWLGLTSTCGFPLRIHLKVIKVLRLHNKSLFKCFESLILLLLKNFFLKKHCNVGMTQQ